MAHSRAVWRPWAAACFAAALLAGGIPAAGAMPFAPDGPSDQDVRDARAALDTARSSVASMEVRLAQLGVDLDDAWVAVERAAEDYTESIVARDAASATVRATHQQLELAEVELETARKRLVAIALKAMRTGSSADQVRAVLESGGVAELVETSEAIEMLGARTNEVVQDFRAATLVAETLRGRATVALAAQEAAVTASEESLEIAQELQREAEEKVTAAEAEREDLLERLAAARETSVQVERERQDRLDAERRERESRDRERDQQDDDSRDQDADGERNRDRDRDRDGDRDRDRDRGDDRDDARDDDARSPEPPRGDDRDDDGGDDAPPTAPEPPSSPEPTPDPKPDPKPKDPKPPKNDPYGLGTGTSVGSASKGKAAVKWAKKQLGVDYVYGGTGNPGFDCSGLTMKAWADAGVSLNRSSRDQYRQVRKIERSQIRPGDLLFWGDNAKENDPSSVTHVAMYIGDGQIIEAPRPGLQVRITPLDGWRMDRIMPFAGRP